MYYLRVACDIKMCDFLAVKWHNTAGLNKNILLKYTPFIEGTAESFRNTSYLKE